MRPSVSGEGRCPSERRAARGDRRALPARLASPALRNGAGAPAPTPSARREGGEAGATRAQACGPPLSPRHPLVLRLPSLSASGHRAPGLPRRWHRRPRARAGRRGGGAGGGRGRRAGAGGRGRAGGGPRRSALPAAAILLSEEEEEEEEAAAAGPAAFPSRVSPSPAWWPRRCSLWGGWALDRLLTRADADALFPCPST